MLYYCSISDEETGDFLGAAILNATSADAAADAACDMISLEEHSLIAVMTLAIGSGPNPLPPIGRLLSVADLKAHFGEELMAWPDDEEEEAEATAAAPPPPRYVH